MDARRQGHLPISIPYGQQELRLCSGTVQNLQSKVCKICHEDADRPLHFDLDLMHDNSVLGTLASLTAFSLVPSAGIVSLRWHDITANMAGLYSVLYTCISHLCLFKSKQDTRRDCIMRKITAMHVHHNDGTA